jgi:hypothetical protein
LHQLKIKMIHLAMIKLQFAMKLTSLVRWIDCLPWRKPSIDTTRTWIILTSGYSPTKKNQSALPVVRIWLIRPLTVIIL